MKSILFSSLLCNLIIASYGDSFENQLVELQQRMGQLESSHQREIKQLQDEVNQLQRFRQEDQAKHEAEITELKRQLDFGKGKRILA